MNNLINSNLEEVYPLFSNHYVFSSEETKKIIFQCLQLESQIARVGVLGNTNTTDFNIRKSNVSWIPANNSSYKWIYDRMMNIIQEANKEHFNFNLNGVQPIQFTEYDSKVEGQYDWHNDISLYGKDNIRKLSISVPLNDPHEYEGGSLVFLYHGKKLVIPTQKPGIGHVFTSYTPHCVTPVISGTRYSLVMWSYGPKFL